ncbi:ATP synthase F1 subunit delta [Paenibacillus oryzae]|uniref:ATP synthase subunit delta n=1 Tax=Paenibacillus oryzae TaxID=1844972 RepID=A0A1A5YDY3_9BACL|nr:F0F1 ATP synthase subunit delta [Paenibacillus oryzae]OBR63605.1 ATP synthase F1 subunit delta [Paenibacillus oryzae]
MSRDTVVAKRYGKAMFELASSEGIVPEVEEQLKLIAESLKQDAEIGKFLSLPNVDTSKKVEALKSAFGGQLSQVVLNALVLILSRGRESILEAVYEAYTRIAAQALGQAHATVYTAKALTEQELSGVEAQFGGITGKKIIAEQIVEPALLGGIQVRIGDRLYDGSLSGKLDRLQKTLNSKAL